MGESTDSYTSPATEPANTAPPNPFVHLPVRPARQLPRGPTQHGDRRDRGQVRQVSIFPLTRATRSNRSVGSFSCFRLPVPPRQTGPRKLPACTRRRGGQQRELVLQQLQQREHRPIHWAKRGRR